jgi:hypothetical protein
MMKKINLKKFIVPSVWLTLAFLLIVVWEGYVLYTQVYQQLLPNTVGIKPENIVRLDLGSYNKTLNLLDQTKNFEPKKINLINPDPFK